MPITLAQNAAPYLLSVLRIIAASSFFTHGTMKLFSWPGPFQFPMNLLLWTAGILEVFGGLLLLMGAFTRPVSFVLSGLMAFAYFMVHAPRGFFPVLNHGEAALLFCFVFLYLTAAGPGPWSIDAQLGRSQAAARPAAS